ncbi:MAG: helix-turn-helix transcriptional regulator [Thomasclavelia sp.]|uniref:helix-turn-helix transcriptional regulator n=1 Tax=Thomasclavelia sp. TaxID=3025757 RepID=UPI0039A1914B
MCDSNNKKAIANNIKKYMNLNNKTRNDVCNDLGFKYTTFSDWINGKKYPRIDKIEMLANYFGIEKSNLIENSNLSINTSAKLHDKVVNATIGARIKALRQKNKYTLDQIADKLKTSRQTVFKYENDLISNIPNDKIEQLAYIFNVSPSYLVGWQQNANNQTRKNLIDAIMKLPDEDIALLDTIVNRLNKKTD